MALSTATVTMNLADMLGAEFDARRTKIWVDTNVPSDTIVDTTGNAIRLGSGKVSLDYKDAQVSVWVPGAGSNPASWQTYIHVDYPDRGTNGRRVRDFGPFTITGDADLADLVEEQEVPPEYATRVASELQAIRDEAAALMAEATAPSVATVTSRQRGGQRLVALGDSITLASDSNAANFVRQDSIADVIAARSNGAIKFVRNAGIGGQTSEEMLARFDTDVAPYNPTLGLTMAGSNDFAGGDYTVDRYMAAIQAITAKWRSVGAVSMFINPPPVNSLTSAKKKVFQQARNELAMFCAAERITLLDVFGAAVLPNSNGDWRGYLTADNIHPVHPGGYTNLGVTVSDVVNGLGLPPLPVLSKYNQDPTNLFVNGLFQDGLNNWGLASNPSSGSASWSVVADGYFPGDYCAQVALSSAVGAATRTQTVSAGPATFAPGDMLEVAAMVDNPVGDAFTSIQLNFTGASGSVLLKRFLNARHIYQHEFVVPTGTTAVAAYITAGTSTASSGNVKFGGLTLRNLSA